MTREVSRVLEFCGYGWEAEWSLLTKDGEVVQISPKALTILAVLVENRSRLVAREELLDAVWPDTNVEEGNLNHYVSLLRRELGPESIRTVPKKGYMFTADVSVRPEPEPVIEPTRGPVGFKRLRTAVAVTASLAIALFATIVFSGGGFVGSPGIPHQPTAGTKMSDVGQANKNYILGRQVWEGRTSAGVSADTYLKLAIEADPNFAAAHLALADSYAFTDRTAEAESCLRRAQELDPAIPGAHATDAFIKMFHHWDWEAAADAFDKAISADPNDAKTRHWYGVYLSLQGRLADASEQMRAAVDIDPSLPVYRVDLAEVLYFARDYAAAEEVLNETLTIFPDSAAAYKRLYDIQIMQGRDADAFNSLARSRNWNADEAIEYHKEFAARGLTAFWELSLAYNGCPAASLAPAHIYGCAVDYARLGDRENALRVLSLGADARIFMLPYIKVDPIFDILRDETRFASIAEQIAPRDVVAK